MAERPDSIGRNTVILGAFALLAAILLGTVSFVTADRIREQQLAAERRALDDIMPADLHNNDLLADAFLIGPDTDTANGFTQAELLQLTESRQAYVARLNGDFSGVILPAEAHDGYGGDILLLVGIMADGTLSGTRVLEHRETPGLGDKIDAGISDWILGFDGKSLDNPSRDRWEVVKDGGDFDGLVGATITPRAVVHAIQRTLEFFRVNRQQLAERQ